MRDRDKIGHGLLAAFHFVASVLLVLDVSHSFYAAAVLGCSAVYAFLCGGRGKHNVDPRP